MNQRTHSSSRLVAGYRLLSRQSGLCLRPKLLVVSCCDFFLDAHVLTTTRRGELLQIRTPGNIIAPYASGPTAEACTVEMAITEFQVSDVIVIGHTPCRCMTNLMSPESLEKMPRVGDWFKYADATRQIVHHKYADRTAYAQVEAAAEENVLVQLSHLKTHPSVVTALAMDQVSLHGWLFSAETGDLKAYAPRLGKYVSMSEVANANGSASEFAVP